MLIRALIVLLVVLNLGAAAWWLTRPAPTPPAEPPLPAGVARLQLVNEAPSTPTQAPVPQARDAVPPAALTAYICMYSGDGMKWCMYCVYI